MFLNIIYGNLTLEIYVSAQEFERNIEFEVNLSWKNCILKYI